MDFKFLLSTSAWLMALLIFCLRVTDMSLDTLRVIFVIRGRKKEAWFLGFMNSMIFVLAISTVLAHMDNPLTVLGYASGFATGNVVGMWLEGKMAIGHTRLTIMTSTLGQHIAGSLRENGFAVTEIPALGRDGVVNVLNCSVLRKQMGKAERIIREADPFAFITSEDVKPIHRGFWRTSKSTVA